jgi:hypothetical protein
LLASQNLRDEFYDIKNEDYIPKPILTNQQIEILIKRLKGTHKEDRIPHLRKFMQAQKIKIVDKDFMVENMKFIQNSSKKELCLETDPRKRFVAQL